MLEITNLSVKIGSKEILHDISLCLPTGETQALFGPNGCGKTTLVMVIMGFPRYRVTNGKIVFKGVTKSKSCESRWNFIDWFIAIGVTYQRGTNINAINNKQIRSAVRFFFFIYLNTKS